MTKINWRQEAWPILLFFLMPLVCFPELFFNGQTLYFADLTWIHYPLRTLAAEQWLAGQVPLWNPYAWLGFPLLAESQVGVLYPLNILFLLPLPPYLALTLFVTLHFSLAATFTYILGRVLGISQIGATVASLSFGFGGFLMTQVPNLNGMTGGVWLPLIFCCFVYALRVQRWEIAVLGGGALALQVLTTQPQIVFYTVLLLVCYALYQTFVGQASCLSKHNRQDACPTAKIWGLLALLGSVGLLLAAPQLLSTWELKNLSVRSDGLSYDIFIFWSLAPQQWLNLILPSLFGNNVLLPTQALSTNFTEAFVYIGILPLVMVFFSWRERHRPEVLFLWLIIPLGVWLSLGGYTPLYRVLHQVPIFDLFRVPARWSLLVTFALSMLSGYGVDAYLRESSSRGLRWGLFGLWAGITVSLLGLSFFNEPLLQWANSLPAESDLTHALQMLLKDSLFKVAWSYHDRIILEPLNWLVMPKAALVTRLGVTVGLLIGYATCHLSRRNFALAALALTAFDLALSGGTAINNVTTADFWQRPSPAANYIITAQQHDPQLARFFSLKDNRQAKNVAARLGEYLPAIYHLFSVTGHQSPLLLAQYDTYNTFLTQYPAQSLTLTGARLVIAHEPILANSFPLVYQDEAWHIYENPNPLPRAFVVHQAISVTESSLALIQLRQATFNPRQTVILETTEPLPPLPPQGHSADQVTLTRYSPSAIEIHAKVDSPAFLVLLDTYYPGWQALVDGQPTPIKRANYFGRAVYLPAGSHTVQFVYRPVPFRIGIALSSVGLLIIVSALRSLFNLWGNSQILLKNSF